MKRYKFPLRPVATLRAHTERKAREALALTIAAYVQSEKKLADVRARTQELEEILFSGRRQRFRAMDEAAFLQAYRQECANEMTAQKEVFAAQAEVDKARALCIDANRQLKMIEKLEEHSRAKYSLEVLRVQQNEFDEMASQRLARQAS